MLISICRNYVAISSILIAVTFVFLGHIFLFKKQDSKLNWAIFYSSLYVSVTLPIINYLCIKFGWWNFAEEGINSIQLPFNIYFLWVVAWGILPVFFLKGKYLLIIAVLMFWLDILIMPELEKIEIITLNKNWIIGELILIGVVFIPSYYWAFCSYNNKANGMRALLQIIVMSCVFIIGLPFILESYGLIDTIQVHSSPFTFQLFIIIVFPSLVAVFDLVKKDELSREDYMTEVEKMLDMYGGYEGVIEKTIRYYIEKYGEWKSNGDDQYSQDANIIATRILKEK